MLRGVAAAIVVFGHIRGFVLVDFGDVTSPGLFDKVVYFIGGMGHQAVIAFFALSGFLVGGKAVEALLAGRFSVPQYVAARLSRLWTVVIPALLLTLAIDAVGAHLSGGRGYDGAFIGILSSGPSPESPADHSLLTFLGNLLFLQTILSPVYGTNGPLWSLAYEFWYYVMFPLAAWAVLSRARAWARCLALGVSILLAAFLPSHITILGLVWLAGAAAYWLNCPPRMRGVFASNFYAAFSAALVAVSLVLTRSGGVGPDLALGFAWASILPALTNFRSLGWLYERIAIALSEISYTLYAMHFPLLAAIYFVLLAPGQFQPGAMTLMLMGLLLLLCMAAAAVFWWCFERNTGVVRNWMLSALPRPVERARHGV